MSKLFIGYVAGSFSSQGSELLAPAEGLLQACPLSFFLFL